MSTTLTEQKINRSLFVEGRLWTDKTFGNTYFSARVWVDGHIIFTIPFEYGYGDQYLYRTAQELEARGYLPPEYAKNKALWSARDEFGIDYYYTATHCNKREMFK